MKLRLVITMVSLACVAASQAQVAQAILASITQDAAVNLYPGVSLIPQSTVHQPKTLDFRAEYINSFSPEFGIPYGYMGSHDYRGYVRVKWIGLNKPRPGVNYGAIFDVWSIRAGQVSIALFHPGPMPRTLTIHASFLNSYLTPLPLDLSVKALGSDSVSGGNFPLGQIFTRPLPDPTGDDGWDYMGNYASAAFFTWQGDGYYANVEAVGITSFNEANQGTAPNGWSPVDAGTTRYETRLIYKLVSVAGQPVN